MIVDYDRLVQEKAQLVRRIFEFAQVPFTGSEPDKLHGSSVAKGQRFSEPRRNRIDRLCQPAYQRALEFQTL